MSFGGRSRRTFVLGALSIILTATHSWSKDRPPMGTPTVFYGYANTLPALWLEKHPRAVTVTFCVRGSDAAPAKGSLVTLVPADDRLPTVVTRVARTKNRDGSCLPVTVEPILLERWRDAWGAGGAWSKYPRLLVVSGEQSKARPLAAETLPSDALPPRTTSEDVRIAIDIDGDGKADAVASCECPGGKCEDCLCQGVWVRTEDHWQRRGRFCDD